MREHEHSIAKRLAKKNISANRGRNIFLVLTVFITTFTIATIISLCINQIEQQVPENDKKEPIIYVLAVLAFIVMIAGYLMINNVMAASVTKDIRLYGLLKIVGMTQKQIKKMIFNQIRYLCAIGIFLGLVAGAFASFAFVPLFLKMYMQYSQEEYSISFHPVIFIGAAIFSFLTSMFGALKPAKIAACLSPIEAVRHSEYSYNHKILTTQYSSMKAAWRNVFRVPGRAVMVFCNLFLGITAFMTVSVILGSANVEMFTELAALDSDNSINLRNGTASWEHGMLNSRDIFSNDLINNLYKVPGLEEMGIRYFSEIKMNIRNDEGDIQELQGYLYGLNSDGISKIYEETGHSIDEEAFSRGEFVIVRDVYRNSLENTQTAIFSVGDKTVSYTIGDIAPSVFNDYYGKTYNWLPCVYISEDVIREIVDTPAVYEIKLNIEKSSEAQALNIVRNLIADNEKIILYSDIAIRLEAETIVSTLTIIGNFISAILWMIGILNFINVIITGIFARQREFALLECVGESKRQIKKELTIEGAGYAVITFILVGILGSVIIYGCFLWMNRQFEYMNFTFPITSLLIMIFTVFSICLFVPRLIYSYVNKSAIADRLKNED